MEDMVLLRPGMQVPELHKIPNIRMAHIGRIGRIFRISRADTFIALTIRVPWLRAAIFETSIRRHIDQHGGVTNGEGRQEEFLISTAQAVVHRANPKAVRDNLRSNTRGTIIDHEIVAHTMQRVLKNRVTIPVRESLGRNGFIVENHNEFAESLQTVRKGRIPLALGL